MPETNVSTSTFVKDLTAGLVVFLVALPLCLGVALASNAPLFSGLLAGIIGGILVGTISGSHTSISGPAAGLTAVVAAQIATLGSFQAFLLAVFLAGMIQMGLGFARAGFLAAFFPSSVIKGLLAAIGIIIILKQIPHLLGRDTDPEGDFAFVQRDQQNTFTEILQTFNDPHPGATLIGIFSIAVLVLWEKRKSLKKSPVPAPLVVVLFGVALAAIFDRIGEGLSIESGHLVQVPVAGTMNEFFAFLQMPDFSMWRNSAIYFAAFTIAAVASLETLLNLEAVDRLDPKQRTSPPSRELIAQGAGNMVAGLIGALPVTSVIVRSSVNINAGAHSKRSAIVHGLLLLVCVAFLPVYLNMIPLSCLAAILLVTGVKLASPILFRRLWNEGRYQFLPFIVTVVAIVLTDLLIGILIGLMISLGFILHSNVRRPIRRIVEKHLGGDVLHIELANQVSFLNRAALTKALKEVPRGGHILLDARNTDYIDPDILDLIRDFTDKTGPAHGVEVSLLGFRSKYLLEDQTQYVDYSTRELQNALTPQEVLRILQAGHERFRTGHRLTRDYTRQVAATAAGQHPLAVVLSCIDSRTPAEIIFDLGVGDIFVVRIAGNIISRKVLGSIEYACAVAGAKLILVMGHTRCGAVNASVKLLGSDKSVAEATGCQHLEQVVEAIQESIEENERRDLASKSETERAGFADEVAGRNVSRQAELLEQQSETLRKLVLDGEIAIVGAMYDVNTGDMKFMTRD